MCMYEMCCRHNNESSAYIKWKMLSTMIQKFDVRFYVFWMQNWFPHQFISYLESMSCACVVRETRSRRILIYRLSHNTRLVKMINDEIWAAIIVIENFINWLCHRIFYALQYYRKLTVAIWARHDGWMDGRYDDITFSNRQFVFCHFVIYCVDACMSP